MISIPRIDLTGQIYGKLTVLCVEGKGNDGHYRWKCGCDCGTFHIISQNHLKRKNKTPMCPACARMANGKWHIVHGDFGTRLYSIYYGILTRVGNPKSPNFIRYGARGIKICDEWAKSYLNFKDWAIKNGYSDDLSIDRIDVNGNYCPENCRWTTQKTQGNNRRDCHYLTIGGEKRTITGWAEHAGLSATAIRNRIQKGYSPKDAVFIPYRKAAALGGGENA